MTAKCRSQFHSIVQNDIELLRLMSQARAPECNKTIKIPQRHFCFLRIKTI